MAELEGLGALVIARGDRVKVRGRWWRIVDRKGPLGEFVCAPVRSRGPYIGAAERGYFNLLDIEEWHRGR